MRNAVYRLRKRSASLLFTLHAGKIVVGECFVRVEPLKMQQNVLLVHIIGPRAYIYKYLPWPKLFHTFSHI